MPPRTATGRRLPGAVAIALLLAAVACSGDAEPEPEVAAPEPEVLLERAIRASEQARTLRFTLDGEGTVQVPDQPPQDLLFSAQGHVEFPDRVRMTMHLDQAQGQGVAQDVLYIGQILYVRPAGMTDELWRTSQTPVAIPGFDPLTAFDLGTLQDTRVVTDGGRDTFRGADTWRLRLEPTEEFLAEAEARLPPEFEGTSLVISQDIWVDVETERIVRVVDRYDYVGRTTGYFETEMRVSDFGAEVSITTPPGAQISDEPLEVTPLEGAVE